MPIKEIKCPVLNRAFQKDYYTNYGIGVPPLEVFVKFNDQQEPLEVMCDRYNFKDRQCKITKDLCLYSQWKKVVH
tara:strand:+ start:170 stop:394 length:225 start_codon:yes stop_codon:yes gene_type:complete